ncbi:basic helix-loop-helix ARNT-like protein 1 [Pocillopora verrucosa]|uniref:basic helix-loop-helix ARNT-like protein 1 n=1 Tax=Pocillopora verrucosa TaxID=203993 RepID=UPI0033413A1A
MESGNKLGRVLGALDSFFLVLSDSGDVFFASENVYRYLGYTQTFLMHQNFLNFVHQEDVVGFERCLRRSARARIVELENGIGLDCQELEEQPIPQLCFCSIKCHAGRQSSHVSPFYYRVGSYSSKHEAVVKLVTRVVVSVMPPWNYKFSITKSKSQVFFL